MVIIIKQTRDEKIAMYMKLTKRELAEFLANRDMETLSNPVSQLIVSSFPACNSEAC